MVLKKTKPRQKRMKNALFNGSIEKKKLRSHFYRCLSVIKHETEFGSKNLKNPYIIQDLIQQAILGINKSKSPRWVLKMRKFTLFSFVINWSMKKSKLKDDLLCISINEFIRSDDRTTFLPFCFRICLRHREIKIFSYIKAKWLINPDLFDVCPERKIQNSQITWRHKYDFKLNSISATSETSKISSIPPL